MSDDVAARLADALQARTRGVTGDPGSLAALTVTRRRRRSPRIAMVAAAVLLVAVVTAPLALHASRDRAPAAGLQVRYPPSTYFVGRGNDVDTATQLTTGSAVYAYAGGPAVRQLPQISTHGTLAPGGSVAYGIRLSEPRTSQIVQVDLVTGAVTVIDTARDLSDSGSSFYSLTLSADGTVLAYSRAKRGGHPDEVVVRSLTRGSRASYPAAGVGQVLDMALSPDGSQLAYAPTHGSGAVYVTPLRGLRSLSGVTPHQVTGCGLQSQYDYPVWSHAGLFVTRACGGTTSFAELDPATGTVRRTPAALRSVRGQDITALLGVLGDRSRPRFLVAVTDGENSRPGDTLTTVVGIVDPARGGRLTPIAGAHA